MTIKLPLASFTFNSKKPREAGFSLLEISIVLAILGLIAGMGLPLLKTHLTHSALAKTRAHQEYCLEALGAFVEKNGCFPAPADPSHQGAQRGLSIPGKTEGIIPFRTLGISERYSKDGMNRQLLYVVEPSVLRTVHMSSFLNRKGQITVVDADGHPVLVENDGNLIALVLISYGEGGAEKTLPRQGDSKLHFQDAPSGNTVLRWESLSHFLKHYTKL